MNRISEEVQLVGAVIALLVVAIVLWFPFPAHSTIERIEWRAVIEIEEFMPVHYVDTLNAPPDDAYNSTSRYQCDGYYDMQSKQYKETCEWRYTYDVDRYVHVRDVVETGTNRNPVFKDYTLEHAELYGNQRVGNKRIEYYATMSFGKQCKVTEDFWQRAEIGERVKAKKSILYGYWCHLAHE